MRIHQWRAEVGMGKKRSPSSFNNLENYLTTPDKISVSIISTGNLLVYTISVHW